MENISIKEKSNIILNNNLIDLTKEESIIKNEKEKDNKNQNEKEKVELKISNETNKINQPLDINTFKNTEKITIKIQPFLIAKGLFSKSKIYKNSNKK